MTSVYTVRLYFEGFIVSAHMLLWAHFICQRSAVGECRHYRRLSLPLFPYWYVMSHWFMQNANLVTFFKLLWLWGFFCSLKLIYSCILLPMPWCSIDFLFVLPDLFPICDDDAYLIVAVLGLMVSHVYVFPVSRSCVAINVQNTY